MSELFHLPHALQGARMAYIDLGERDDLRFMAPLAFGRIQGLPWGRIGPGEKFEQPTVPIAWTFIIDDRSLDGEGPNSFHADTLQWLFADATKIAIDAAEPAMWLYEHFVEEGLKGKRILIVQTVEDRRVLWRDFSRENCGLYGVLELIPIVGDPDQCVLPKVARFEGRSEPRK
jgi:hypothetical protein